MNTRITVALAIGAIFSSASSLAQLSIDQPPSRVAVPRTGEFVNVPFAGSIQWNQNMVPCGADTHTWLRDGAESRSCSDSGGGGCTVYYSESATTRGSHVAHDAATFWAFFTYNFYGSCVRMSDSASRTYIVQYPPTATITSAPTQVQMNHSACFSGTGTVDTQYSANGAPTYQWNWGDGSTTTTATGTACHTWTYQSAGNTPVTFKVSDGGLSATETRTVFIYGKESGCQTC